MIRNLVERNAGVGQVTPVGVQRVKAPAGGLGGCASHISIKTFDWGNIIHFSKFSRGRKEQKQDIRNECRTCGRKRIQYEHAGREWTSLQPLYRGSKNNFRVCFAKNSFSPQQSGFRQKTSTSVLLINIQTNISQAFHDKKHLIAVYLDIEKAYEMTWRHQILKMLEYQGIPRSVMSTTLFLI